MSMMELLSQMRERASQSQEAAQRKPAVVLYHSFGQMCRTGKTLYRVQGLRGT